MVKLLTGLFVPLALFLVPQNSWSAAAGKQVVIAYAAMNARVAPPLGCARPEIFCQVRCDGGHNFCPWRPDLGSWRCRPMKSMSATPAEPPWSERWPTAPI